MSKITRAEAIEQAKLLKALIELAEVSIILDTFFNAFLHKTVHKPDGMWYLHGNFNLGGTLSGRLSSSKINLQNLPSTGSKYASIVKQCFVAPDGWLLSGADFNSLEDMISALTTKDPNKLKVYIDGYDGHCLRAYAYYGDQMPDIVETVDSINSIAKKYKPLRQASKGPTFALTYQGTWHTLVNNLGLPKDKAQMIEDRYHTLYEVSDKWVQDKLNQACKDGYVTLAFGLRLRTPILAQTILNKTNTPYEAAAEGRTAGNALGQSYGMLNNRAAIEFRRRLMASPFKYDILPISHIHDAQYFLVRDNLDTIHWYNKNLTECMAWQELPEIQHNQVKIGGECEIYYPDWSKPTGIPVNADHAELESLIKKAKAHE